MGWPAQLPPIIAPQRPPPSLPVRWARPALFTPPYLLPLSSTDDGSCIGNKREGEERKLLARALALALARAAAARLSRAFIGPRA